MMEFKIIKDGDYQNNISSNMEVEQDVICNAVYSPITQTVRFDDVNYKCAWFAIRFDNTGNNKLVGPLQLDLNLLKDSNTRTIIDTKIPEITGLTIESISNESENLIDVSDIPDWMINQLVQSVNFIDID